MSALTIELLPMTVSQRRTIQFERAVLDLMKVKPGEQIEIDLLLDGCCVLRGPRSGDISDLYGILANVPRGREGPVSIEEMSATIARGWAGEE